MNDDVTPAAAEAPPEEWALVEIFGHRQHYGRIVEVERFGTKLLRVDEPTEVPDTFKTHFYSGGSIFSITPITEQTARSYHERYRPRPEGARPIAPRQEAPGAAEGAEDHPEERMTTRDTGLRVSLPLVWRGATLRAGRFVVGWVEWGFILRRWKAIEAGPGYAIPRGRFRTAAEAEAAVEAAVMQALRERREG